MRYRRTLPMTLAALGAVLATGAAAQVDVRTSVDTTLVTVGDRIELTIAVAHPSDAVVVWPDSLDLSPFEVLGARVEEPTRRGDRTTTTARFTLTAFELGDLEIPSVEVRVRAPDGSEVTASSDRFGVEVASVGLDEGTDIVEIRGPLSIPVGPLQVGLIVLALLLLLGAAYWAVRRMRSRQAPVTPEPVVSPRAAHEIALEALDRLASSGMLERGAVKEFHIEISEILRRYLEGRYRVSALEMTTVEILDGLGRVGVSEEFREGLRSILVSCDLVKFAKVRPSTAESRGSLDRARALVEASAPRPVAEAVG